MFCNVCGGAPCAYKCGYCYRPETNLCENCWNLEKEVYLIYKKCKKCKDFFCARCIKLCDHSCIICKFLCNIHKKTYFLCMDCYEDSF